MEIALNFLSSDAGEENASLAVLSDCYRRQVTDKPVSRLLLTVSSNDRTANLLASDFIAALEDMSGISVVIFVVAQPGVQDHDGVVSLYRAVVAKAAGCQMEIVLSEHSDGFAFHASPSNGLHVAVGLYRQLQSRSVASRWIVPLRPELVFRLEGLVSVARDQGVDILLVPADFIDHASPGLNDLAEDERLFCWDFITYRLLEADRDLLSVDYHDYYRQLISLLTGTDEKPLPHVRLTIFYSQGKGWHCQSRKISHPALRDSVLANAGGEPEVASRREILQSIIGDLQDVASVGGRGHLLRLLAGSRSGRDALQARKLKRVLLIGAYGGEHIGDAAILGGVILRMHRLFGTTEAVLMTQRLAHTEHLIPMLDLPVSISVDIYEPEPIRRYVEWCDAVVFAGGPLIDLPKQLVRHIYTVSLAKRAGKPFIAEGIGPGPFARMPSRFTARRLIEMADRITLRAADAAEHELVAGREFEVGLCPAFDYLESRGGALTRLPEVEATAIDRLLANTGGGPVIGINIRPIGYLYTHGAPDDDVAGFTRRTEAKFEQQLAEGLREYSERSASKPCFIFFPMNAIQFGMSDLRSAYRIQKLLGNAVDFRIWEADASLDGVLALIRRLDIAITMRFHATIFALSQQCKVIGIDYRIGKKDKVAGLLDDVGQGEHCARIDLLTSEWLVAKLEELL